MKAIATTPEPPYYAVIFTSARTDNDEGYKETSERMLKLAAEQPGYLGVESVRETGLGITVSYWRSEEAIRSWKRQVDHLEAQRKGRTTWYRSYRIRACKVERDYGFDGDR
ncbi:MAG TPA: antibiotic biosynthesis monooxygenase [Nitrospiria bacterium]|jgi:heme-degrading monooxygenase HmoA|nr:antibiotic biosynthesis monooxygenase [Nitrospiria bacterium]